MCRRGRGGGKQLLFQDRPHDKLNFKFVRTGLGNFTLHLTQLIGSPVYFGFFVDWCVLTLCLWGLTIYDWYVLVFPRKRDDVALRHEGYTVFRRLFLSRAVFS